MTELPSVNNAVESSHNRFPNFSDCRNLTNQRYVASIDVIADARTEPKPEIFHPGDGRSFYGGISWSW